MLAAVIVLNAVQLAIVVIAALSLGACLVVAWGNNAEQPRTPARRAFWAAVDGTFMAAWVATGLGIVALVAALIVNAVA